VPTARAEKGDFRVTIEEVGVLRAQRGERLMPQTWGMIETIVDDGAMVQKGDVVVQLDTTELQSHLSKLDADLEEARSQASKQLERVAFQQKSQALDLAVSKANRDFAERKLQSARKSAEDARRQHEKGLISAQAKDEKEQQLRLAELDSEKAGVAHERKLEEAASAAKGIEVEKRQAEATFKELAQQRELITSEIEKAKLVSPGSGRVFFGKRRYRGSTEERKPRVGDEVAPWYGSLAEIPDLSSIEVRSQLDETLLGRVPEGTPVEVEVGAVEGLVLTGRVARIDMLAVPRSRSEGGGFRGEAPSPEAIEQVVFPTTITVDSSDERLQPGMTVTVRYVLQTVPGAVSVPESAVFGSGGEAFVFVKSGRAPERREVSLGPGSAGRVVVTEGLGAGEEVYLGDPRGGEA
jgi:multidrug efflux pump subunit AcrA (membrane-fusion protein)